MKDLVVLLHGILRSKLDMLPLSLYLKHHSYDTLNILYPSRRASLEDIAALVHEQIESHRKPGQTLNFVTHSMGGLVARYYIGTYKPENLGKVVMLATPNQGSEWADFLSTHKMFGGLYKDFFGPAGQQLTTAYKDKYPPLTCPVGIIAGTMSINPLAVGVLNTDHDGIVTVDSTHLEGMTDHITLPATHSFMMFNPLIMRETLNFLRTGTFTDRKTPENSPPAR